jgi:hypothetical protein
MIFSLNETRRHNNETLDSNHRQLNGERRRTVVNPMGYTYTNGHDPVNSVFAFKTKKILPEKRVLNRLKKMVEETDQQTVKNILPFLTLARDKARLQKLETESRNAREQGEDPAGLEKERLAQVIAHKERMQSGFIGKMRLANQKARVITSQDRAEWPIWAVFPFSMELPEEPPQEDQ